MPEYASMLQIVVRGGCAARRTTERLTLVILTLGLFGCQVEPTATALVGGTLIDGTGAAPIDDAVIVIRDGRVAAVGSSQEVQVPASSRILDVSGRWVLPGLIESNGHAVFDGQIDHAAYFAERQGSYREIGVANLQIMLEQGITTLRDTHGPTETLLELRASVDSGRIAGPRLFTSGAILNYESLLDIPTERSLDPERVGRARAALDRFVGGADEGAELVARVAEDGVDFVKISLSGRSVEDPRPHRLTDEAIAQMVNTAREAGLRTTSHTMNVPDLERAVRLGFDALEHPAFTLQGGAAVPLPPALAEEMARRGVYSIPLVVAMEVYITFLENPELLDDPELQRNVPSDLLEDARQWVDREASDPTILSSRRARLEGVRANLRTLIEAEAPIAMGTDKGTRLNYHEHANHVRELEIYVELGMTPLEAIRSATLRGAELLGLEDRLGTIEVGKLADMVVLEADPV